MTEYTNEEDISRYKLISMASLFIAIAGNLIIAFFIIENSHFLFELILLIQGATFLVSHLFYLISRKIYQKYSTMSWVLLAIFIGINLTSIIISIKEYLM